MSIWRIKVDPERPWDAQWTTKDGRTMRIGDMDRSHRENLLAYLERHAVSAKNRYVWWLHMQPWPTSDMALDRFAREVDAADEQDAVEWLNDLPFVKALRSITPPGPGTSPRRWQNRRAQLRAANPAAFLAWLDEVQAA